MGDACRQRRIVSGQHKWTQAWVCGLTKAYRGTRDGVRGVPVLAANGVNNDCFGIANAVIR
jgi:hypothetical protein